MNVVRVKEKQAEILKRLVECKILDPSLLQSAINSPFIIFELDSGLKQVTDQEREFIYSSILHPNSARPRWMPFEMFRVSFRTGFDLWMTYRDTFIVFRHMYEDERGPSVTYVAHLNADEKWELRCWNDFQSVSRERLDKIGQETLNEAMWAPFNHIRNVLFFIHHPAFITVSVGPLAVPHKSVQWRIAREHICIIRRRQALSLHSNQGTIGDAELNRAAHWRRGHLRRLSSARYRKRGQLVFVKQAWVGPREWIGSDKKTYRICDIKPTTSL